MTTVIEALPIDWVQERDEQMRLGAAEYQRYTSNHSRAKAAKAAVERLRRDLPAAEREECERVASQLHDARREADHGLAAHKQHLRRATEILEEHPASFVTWAQAKDEMVKAAANALVEPLRAYLAAWAAANDRWEEIRRASRVHLNVGSVGLYPGDAVSEMADPIPCPISATAAEQILTVMPRPRGMA